MESIYCLTQLHGGEIYIILLLHNEQLHVSALDNGHLQVVHESLNKQLYKHIYELLVWGRGGGESGHEISYLSEGLGRVGCMEGSCCYQAMS